MSMPITFESSSADYLRFAVETVDTFLSRNGRLPTMDFVMTHLRHTSVLFGHKPADRGVYSVVAVALRTRFPALDPVSLAAAAAAPALPKVEPGSDRVGARLVLVPAVALP
jgi:hypothetical protein